MGLYKFTFQDSTILTMCGANRNRYEQCGFLRMKVQGFSLGIEAQQGGNCLAVYVHRNIFHIDSLCFGVHIHVYNSL